MRIQPGIPEIIVEPSNEVHVVNGREVRGVNKVVSKETFEQYRQGYRCFACDHAPQPEAFPEHCVEPYCRYEMREKQLADLEFHDRGSARYGPTPWDEVDEMFAEEDERTRHWLKKMVGRQDELLAARKHGRKTGDWSRYRELADIWLPDAS